MVAGMRPPGLPTLKPLTPMFGGLYAAAYGLGGQPLVRQAMARYGPVISLPVLGFGNVVLVADATLAKQVFTEKPDVLLGGEGVGPAAAIYGRRSMFVQEEPEHLRRRKILIPPLHGQALAEYVPIIEAVTRSAMDTWPVGRPMRILEAARELTLDIIVQVIFGVSEPAAVRRLGRPFEELLDLALSEETPARYALRRVGGLLIWGRLARINRRIDELVMPLIAEARGERERTDVLAILANATTEDGDRLSDNVIRADLITLMLAGHETTATTLAWLLNLVLHHPEVLARLRGDIQSGQTEYTQAVINETLRLRPAAPITGRMTVGRYRLGDYTLDPGTRIVLLLDAINRDPQTYPDPDEFRPERFLGQRPHPYAWVPFGGGIKRCLGASFSMCEMTTMLQTMLRHGDFQPVSERPEAPSSRAAPVVVPRHGTRVYFNPTDLLCNLGK